MQRTGGGLEAAVLDHRLERRELHRIQQFSLSSCRIFSCSTPPIRSSVADVVNSALAGFTASVVLIVAIGSQNAFVLRQGLRREHVLPVVLTCAVSDLALIAAGIAGLGAVVSTQPTAVTVIRWGGAAFLLAYAALAAKRAWRPSALKPTDRAPATLRATLLTCLALTYLSPHVYLDTVLLLGSVAQQHQHRWLFGIGAAARLSADHM